jgi:hypothetical protein
MTFGEFFIPSFFIRIHSVSIDVLIIGDLTFTDVVKALHQAQTIVKREINPKVYTRSEWKKLLNDNNSFSKEILLASKIFIIGAINDIE